MAVLDVLLGVVPGAAAGAHRDRDEQAGDDRAHQQAAERRRAEQQADQDRRDHRQQRRDHHFLDRGLGQHVDRDAVFRLGRAFHDPLDVAELAPHFDDDRAGGAADRFHRHRAEQVGDQAADEQADDDARLAQVERDAHAAAGERVGVVGEQDERGQTGRADRVALGHRLGRVADGVERVGDVAHARRQLGHLGDAAGVVGDRAVGVEGDDDAGHAQHRGRGDGDAVEAGEPVGDQDRDADAQHRPRGRVHRHAEAGDDVGAVAGGRRLGDVLHRLVLRAGVVLGDPDHRRGQHQADGARRRTAPSPRPCRRRRARAAAGTATS